MSEGEIVLADGRRVPVDEKGYLTDWSHWDRSVTEQMARQDGVELTPDHWEVIEVLREYFSRFEIEPPMRALVKLVGEKLGEGSGSSRLLYRLFPQGPITQGCRYAGLPRPLSCI